MIIKNWWKILSVVILLYVIIVGMATPLSPGITTASPSSAKVGNSLTLKVEGYNSHYQDAENIRAWLKIDDELSICAGEIVASSNNQLTATFIIPDQIPSEEAVQPTTLLLSNEIDGTSVFPDAVFITKDSITGSAGWNCMIEDLYQNDQYDFPFRNILAETIRNLYFHVPLWFGMIFLFLASVIYSIRYLRNPLDNYDIKAVAYAKAGILYGILGTVTGAIWAKYTWGAYWSFDVKQNMSAICLLIYAAYFVLRTSFDDEQRKARISAVYNIFAFAAMIPLLFVIPRLADSLHPGNGGNPALGTDDLDNTMRTVFYPAVIGWTLLGFWMSELIIRTRKVEQHLLEDE